MELENILARVKHLIEQRDQINAELVAILGGTAPPAPRKPITCGHCHQEGHTARSCPSKQPSG